MQEAGIFILIILGGAAVVGVWILSMSFDKERITAYIQERGGRIVSISYAPFGKGWFGEKNDRIYEVVYYDKAGSQHFATCKTSFWSGVYWTEDRVTHHKSKWYDSIGPANEPGHPLIGQIADDPPDEATDELERLREENARLRQLLAASGKCPACGASIAPEAARCPDCQVALK